MYDLRFFLQLIPAVEFNMEKLSKPRWAKQILLVNQFYYSKWTNKCACCKHLF